MEGLDKPGIEGEPFNLIFSKGRRKGMSDTYFKYVMEVLSTAKKQYQLKRIKSRLRVSFIGYSYYTKLIK